MNKTSYIIIVLVVVIAVIAGLGVRSRRATQRMAQLAQEETSLQEQITPEEATDIATTTENQVATTTQEVTKNTAPKSNTVTIVYNGTAFVPSSVSIKKGDTVTYKNESTTKMWPASAKHPTHGEYPTKGGCLGSTFDACIGIEPKGSWSFTFDVTGDWKFHDHLNPRAFGSVKVE